MTTTLNAERDSLPIPDPECVTAPRIVSAAEGYERWALTYDDAPNPLLAREERYLLPLLGPLRGKSVLDLACGTGRWLERIAAQDASGVGIDCSEAMLRIAGRKNAIKSRIAQAACQPLPFRAAVFDLVICSFALGHFRDLNSMVGELARVTKPGADVFISDLHPEACARGWRVGFRDVDTEVQIEVTPRSAEEVVSAFSSYGLECVTRESLRIEEPEKMIFDKAGRSHSFAKACSLPAVLICHFKRDASASGKAIGQTAEARP